MNQDGFEYPDVPVRDVSTLKETGTTIQVEDWEATHTPIVDPPVRSTDREHPVARMFRQQERLIGDQWADQLRDTEVIDSLDTYYGGMVDQHNALLAAAALELAPEIAAILPCPIDFAALRQGIRNELEAHRIDAQNICEEFDEAKGTASQELSLAKEELDRRVERNLRTHEQSIGIGI